VNVNPKKKEREKRDFLALRDDMRAKYEFISETKLLAWE